MDIVKVVERVESRLRDLTLSPRAASMLTGKGPDVIRNLQRAAASGETQYNPKLSTIKSLSDVLQTTPDWLLYGAGEKVAKHSQFRNLDDEDIPVFATMEHGNGLMAVSSYIVDRFKWPSFLQRENLKEVYGLVVEGDSAAPFYEPGDVVIVNGSITNFHQHDVVVRSEGTRVARIRRFLETKPSGEFMFRRYNPDEVETERAFNSFGTIVAKISRWR